MGYNIGIRIVDEFLAKGNVTKCNNFRDTSEMIGKVAFKMFLGITVEVSNWSTDGNSCSLIIQENPFTEFVELPPQYTDIHYCNILVGVIQGALEMVGSSSALLSFSLSLSLPLSLSSSLSLSSLYAYQDKMR